MFDDTLMIIGEPAFKGSVFTALEYKDVWGDDWHTLFMELQTLPTMEELCK